MLNPGEESTLLPVLAAGLGNAFECLFRRVRSTLACKIAQADDAA